MTADRCMGGVGPWIEKPARKPRQSNKQKREADAELAIPKGQAIRIIDAAAIKAARKPFCECCRSRRGPFQIHHLDTRGSGGGDLPELLLNLCTGPGTNDCHGRVHNGRISKDELRSIIRARSGQ